MGERLLVLLSDLFHVPEAELGDDKAMQDIELWDSLKHMELVVSLEQAYSIELSTDDIMAMQSIGEIRRIMRERNVQC